MTHAIHDQDPHFLIDPTTRSITNRTPGKVMLMQFDHNSERFTFEVPREIEGHDMSRCTKIEVHYLNLSGDRQNQTAAVYLVDDVTFDDEKVTFSWLLSHNVTQYAGALSFLVRFSCVNDGKLEYAWNTAVFSGISIASGMDNNGEEPVEEVGIGFFAKIIQWQGQVDAMEANVDAFGEEVQATKAHLENTASGVNTRVAAFDRKVAEVESAVDNLTEQVNALDYTELATITPADENKILRVSYEGKWYPTLPATLMPYEVLSGMVTSEYSALEHRSGAASSRYGSNWKDKVVEIELSRNFNTSKYDVKAEWNADIDNQGFVKCYILESVSSPDILKLVVSSTCSSSICANPDSRFLFKGFTAATQIKGLQNLDVSQAVLMTGMFHNCHALTSLDLSKWDTRNVKSMNAMFMTGKQNEPDTSALASIKFGSKFSTANVLDMSQTFYGCSKLTTIDVAGWDVSKVVDMSHMFADCVSLQALDLSAWNAEKCRVFDGFLNDCTALASLNVSNLVHASAQYVSQFVERCTSLVTITGLDTWDTSGMFSFSEMFYGCTSLEELDLHNFDTTKSASTKLYGSPYPAMADMFKECPALKEVYLGEKFVFNDEAGKYDPYLPDGVWYCYSNGAYKNYGYTEDDLPVGLLEWRTAVPAGGMLGSVKFTNAAWSGEYPRMEIKTTATNLAAGFTLNFSNIKYSDTIKGFGLILGNKYAYDGVGLMVSYVEGKVMAWICGGTITDAEVGVKNSVSYDASFESVRYLGSAGALDLGGATSFKLQVKEKTTGVGTFLAVYINDTEFNSAGWRIRPKDADGKYYIGGKVFDPTNVVIGLVPCYNLYEFIPGLESMGIINSLKLGTRALADGESISFKLNS